MSPPSLVLPVLTCPLSLVVPLHRPCEVVQLRLCCNRRSLDLSLRIVIGCVAVDSPMCVVVRLSRLTVPLGKKCVATQWLDNLVVVTTVLLATSIPRRVLKALCRLCRTTTARVIAGLGITIGRK